MTKLEFIRDELAELDCEFPLINKDATPVSNWKRGFDASTAEWKRMVEPFVEALKFYEREHEHHKTHIFEQNKAKEALEKYYGEVGE